MKHNIQKHCTQCYSGKSVNKCFHSLSLLGNALITGMKINPPQMNNESGYKIANVICENSVSLSTITVQ